MLLNYTGSCHHKENEQFENFKTLSPTPSQNNWKKMEQGLLKACVDFVDTGFKLMAFSLLGRCSTI
jgi:hypothetical protein